jgi:DNA modification methylase
MQTDTTHNIVEQIQHLAVAIGEINFDPANARKHDQRNLEAIKASLAKFGQRTPIVVQQDGMVVRAGNGRLAAAKALGWTHIAAVVLNDDNATAAQFAIADNRTAELAEWDNETLALLLDGWDKETREAVGFTDGDIQQMLQELEPEAAEIVEDEVPAAPVEPITKAGDLWILGQHRLLCGDSTSAQDVQRLMDGAKADLCFTSPPYGQQRDYTEESKAKVADWDGLMRGVFGNLPMSDKGQVLVNLGLIHQDGQVWTYYDGWIAWMKEQKWKLFGWYVWDKISATFKANDGRPYVAHEWVFHFNKRSVPCIEWMDCKHAGTTRSVWGQRKPDGSVPELCTPGEIKSHKPPDSISRIQRETNNADASVRSHPARFPVALADYWIKTWPGESVFEPFCGSGTTLIAAEQLGRKCYGMEISPQYCDVIVKRWETLTGKKAVLSNG